MSDHDLVRDLETALGPSRVHADTLTRLALASDASAYRLVPRVVVRPEDTEQVRALLAVARARKVGLCFRAAGTSLSGQAVTDGILVDLSRGWRRLDVLDGGARVRAEPGVIGARINAALRPHGKKLGPDPASIHACMLGGIVANNSSGMCCGTEHNAYRTLESLRLVLASGTVLDTAAPAADAHLRAQEPALYQGLLALRADLLSDPELAARVAKKHRQKNTTGYGLNALLDFERPVDLLRQLVVGSEGTLAFIAEATLRTVPDLSCKRTALLLFPDVHAACAAIGPLAGAGAKALELLDRASLAAVADKPGVPPGLAALPGQAAALLAELQAATPHELAGLASRADAALGALRLLEPPRWTEEPAEQAVLWRVRQGLFPAIGAARPAGTAVLIEDVCFPLERLAEGVLGLEALLAVHGYRDAAVFGHAKDGNLHFVLPQSFATPEEVARYARFMDDLVALVLRHEGALKAEHGTGRNVAPFVEAEWGSAAVALMRRLKTLCDPLGILNPGVLLSSEPRGHLSHLKALPPVDPEVDTCIECGFCEPRCPSRDLTLTPRQRIVLRREQARSPELAAELDAELSYALVETCAADGLCATACPVSIDTGALVKRLRGEERAGLVQGLAAQAAGWQSWLERGMRVGLGLLGVVPRPLRARLAGGPGSLPRAASGRLPRTERSGASAVYLPTCPARLVAPPPGAPPLPEALVRLGARASQPLWIPPGAPGTCCGLLWGSKGLARAQAMAASRSVDRLWDWSEQGRLPVVLDASPCAHALAGAGPLLDAARRERLAALRLQDAVEWLAQALPSLAVRRRAGRVAVHAVCSLQRRGAAARLETVVRAAATSPFFPPSAGCCGTAGDRGIAVPELLESATRGLAAEIRAAGCASGVATSPTCEHGLAQVTRLPWFHAAHLLEWATRSS